MGREHIRNEMMKRKRMALWKNEYLLNEFCTTWKVDPQDILSYCEGIELFEEWYKDFIKYLRDEFRNRIETGQYRPIDFKDVWGGGTWEWNYI